LWGVRQDGGLAKMLDVEAVVIDISLRYGMPKYLN
jgi:hypothetical protein